MDESSVRRGSVRDVLIFFIGFAAVWTADVVLVWRLELVPEPLRPWLRTALWIGAVAVWIAWQRPPAPWKWLGLAPITPRQLASTLAAFAVIFGWNLVRVHVMAAPLHQLAAVTPARVAWGLVGVFVEELMFRGVVQTRLAEQLPAPAAIPITAVLFLLIHVPGWMILSIPADVMIVTSVFLIGLICGALRHWSGSLWPGVAAHWANNLGALL
jgi:membrane protease YdiL (CAAX protease family)